MKDDMIDMINHLKEIIDEDDNIAAFAYTIIDNDYNVAGSHIGHVNHLIIGLEELRFNILKKSFREQKGEGR